MKITKKALDVFGGGGDVMQCSATGLCFSDDSFDIVNSFGVIHHVPNAKTAVGEIARVIRPGGE